MWIQKSCAAEKCWNSRENLFSICHHPASWLCERSLSSSACYRKNETLFNWKYTHLKVHHRLVELGVGAGGCGEETSASALRQRNGIFACNSKTKQLYVLGSEQKKKTMKVLRSLGFAHDFMLLLSLRSPNFFTELSTRFQSQKVPSLDSSHTAQRDMENIIIRD